MLVHWIWYAMLPQVRSFEKRALLEYFSDPEEIYHATEEALERCEDLSQQTKEALLNKDLQEAEEVLRQCRRKEIGVLTYNDSAYPNRLRNIKDAPMVLYYRGKLPDFSAQPVVGVVGTRRATAYGKTTAERMAHQMAVCGALVVSGAAEGIDAAAMEGALSAGCPVVGVLGCGVDVVYPRCNRKLFDQTVENGCLLSEYPPATKPLRWNFPQRNRIISGISNGVLVVEAPEKSGALITADIAIEQGRDVFVVPGNVDVAACAGSNALLREYAAAVCSGWDVVKDYASLYPGKIVYQQERKAVAQVAQKTITPAAMQMPADKICVDNRASSSYSKTSDFTLTVEEQSVLDCVPQEQILIDDVIARVNIPAGKVLAILTMLALKGIIVNHPGRRVSRKGN